MQPIIAVTVVFLVSGAVYMASRSQRFQAILGSYPLFSKIEMVDGATGLTKTTGTTNGSIVYVTLFILGYQGIFFLTISGLSYFSADREGNHAALLALLVYIAASCFLFKQGRSQAMEASDG